MLCKKNKSIWQLILWLLVLLAVMWTLNGCMLLSTAEPYPFKSVSKTSINEKCRVFQNWGVSNSEFMKWVHKMVDGTDYIEIRTIDGRRLEGKIFIETVVVYYKK